jgi:hypothetical protein
MNTSKPYMLFKSVSTAANRSSNPAAFEAWITELQNQVEANGQFEKSAAGYLPFSPPPFFWDYKCAKCRFAYQLSLSLQGFKDNGSCQLVDGDIEHNAWCCLWMPPDDYATFSWPSQLIEGDW